LVITGDRITAVGAPNDTKIPHNARTIDGTGKFILPGYIAPFGTTARRLFVSFS
jgi:imidazolonepropionase-like amidohydrolase